VTLLKLNVPATFEKTGVILTCSSARSAFLIPLIIKQHPRNEEPWKIVGKTTWAFPVLAACFGILVTTFHDSESYNAGYLARAV